MEFAEFEDENFQPPEDEAQVNYGVYPDGI
jgi:hypothetical protein